MNDFQILQGWLSSEKFFFGGGGAAKSIVMQFSIVMFTFLLFSGQIQGGELIVVGGCPPLEESP